MPYDKYHTGKIEANEKGIAKRVTENIRGKIIKVRIIYSELATQLMNLTISTVEKETVVLLPEWNENILLYPRHSVINERVARIPVSGQEPAMEPFVSVGPLIIGIDGAEHEGEVIEDIIITYET